MPDIAADYSSISDAKRKQILMEGDSDPILLIERVFQICGHWAYFTLEIINPLLSLTPGVLVKPENFKDGTYEYVYDIYDEGVRLKTSKAQDMFSAGSSMCKLYYTIEKMIFLLVEKLQAANIDSEAEVQVAFAGFEQAQRKAFESIINLKYNVVVTNFDPGAWGEKYLQAVNKIAEKYGYPPEAPRQGYRITSSSNNIQSKT